METTPSLRRPPPVEIPISNTGMSGEALLSQLLTESIIAGDDWDNLSIQVRDELMSCRDCQRLLERLVDLGLLTEHQAKRVQAGKAYELILGNYRVLARLGSGAMGIVFRAEHIRMRRQVAIKVLPISRDEPSWVLQRFYVEMRALAQLEHPNIISAIDAGEVVSPDPNWPILHYYVMEYVQGQNLEDYVRAHSQFSVARACDLAHQVAWALMETHKHNLIHRDIKPSNILLTPEGQAKLLDFGLVRHFHHRMTELGAALGTPLYMAPEQALDASKVDNRADIYGLGATLFWCLTGRDAFPCDLNIAQAIRKKTSEPPPSARALRPEIPADLDAVVRRMMALKPDERYPTAQAVMTALVPFLQPDSTKIDEHTPPPATRRKGRQRVLVVDDETGVRIFCRHVLEARGLECDEAASAPDALMATRAKDYDLVLSDWRMPEMTGAELCRQLREKPPSANLKVILFSGGVSAADLAQMLSAGADDYLTKPFQGTELASRVEAALRLKDAQDRSDELNLQLRIASRQLRTTAANADPDLNRLQSLWRDLSESARANLVATAEALAKEVEGEVKESAP